MCLITLAYRITADQHLIVAANRDEAHQRPTARAARWPDAPQVIAGRDLQAGGTWLGITDGLRFAAVTNYREQPPTIGPHSRGDLVADFLRGSASAADYARSVEQASAQYSGFSLLLADPNELWTISNRGEGSARRLEPGIYTLSNGELDAPWPKSLKLRSSMERAVELDPNDLEESLLASMRDRDIAPLYDLPKTGIEPVLEQRLSAAFIVGKQYGTRCSTFVSISQSGGHLTERSFDPQGSDSGSVSLSVKPSDRSERENA